MSAVDHAAIEELLAVRALDGLDGDDVGILESALTSHGDCATCRALDTEFTETAALLAASLSPAVVDPSIADRIVAAGRAPRDELAARRGRRRGFGAWVAVAAALLLVVGGVAVVRGRPQPVAGTTWAQQVVHFEGEGDLAMAFVPGTPGAAFWGSDLPDPGEGQTLEIWMIEGDTPVAGGCVTPHDGGIAVFVEADVGTTDTMAVTVEPDDCPAAPTGEVTHTAALA
jgi:hypothetical protein